MGFTKCNNVIEEPAQEPSEESGGAAVFQLARRTYAGWTVVMFLQDFCIDDVMLDKILRAFVRQRCVSLIPIPVL